MDYQRTQLERDHKGNQGRVFICYGMALSLGFRRWAERLDGSQYQRMGGLMPLFFTYVRRRLVGELELRRYHTLLQNDRIKSHSR